LAMKASELKRGMIIREGDDFFIVAGIEHRTPGNKRAIYQTSLKNLLDGRIFNKRYSPTDTVEKADLEAREVQYLYHDHSGYHFMDMTTYETILVREEIAGDYKDYLKENLALELLYHEHHLVTLELPVSIDMKVAESSPGLRGDTSGKALKSATLETGMKLNVPLFIKEGDVVTVDTRTGEYLGRA